MSGGLVSEPLLYLSYMFFVSRRWGNAFVWSTRKPCCVLGLLFMSRLPRAKEKSKVGSKTPAEGWNIWSWKSVTCSFNKNSLLCELPRDLLQPGPRHCLVWTHTTFGEEGGKKAAKWGYWNTQQDRGHNLWAWSRTHSQVVAAPEPLYPGQWCLPWTQTCPVSYVLYL